MAELLFDNEMVEAYEPLLHRQEEQSSPTRRIELEQRRGIPAVPPKPPEMPRISEPQPMPSAPQPPTAVQQQPQQPAQPAQEFSVLSMIKDALAAIPKRIGEDISGASQGLATAMTGMTEKGERAGFGGRALSALSAALHGVDIPFAPLLAPTGHVGGELMVQAATSSRELSDEELLKRIEKARHDAPGEVPFYEALLKRTPEERIAVARDVGKLAGEQFGMVMPSAAGAGARMLRASAAEARFGKAVGAVEKLKAKPAPLPDTAAIVKQGGGDLIGESKGLAGEDLVWFNDPQTGSTLLLPKTEVSPEAIAAKLAESRKAFEAAKPLARAIRESAPIPERIPAASQAIKELHDANGGSSFNFKNGDLAGTDAFAVGFAPDLAERIPGHPTVEQIQAFIEKAHRVGIPLNTPKISVGTFFENGFTDLDIIATPRNLEEAVALGKEFNQRSIFDLKNFQVIDTGGTGLTVENIPSLSERITRILGAHGEEVFPSSVVEQTQRSGAAALEALHSFLKRTREALTSEAGAVGKPSTLAPEEFRSLSYIGAAAIARGMGSKAAFRHAIEGAYSVGPWRSFTDIELAEVMSASRKIFERNVQSAIRSGGNLPNTKQLLKIYEQGKFRLDWYDDAWAELQKLFGEDAALVANLIAATSPRTPVAMNVKEGIEVYLAHKGGYLEEVWDAAGTFAGPAHKVKQALTSRVLAGGRINTPKAGSFAENIMGNPNAVTIDSWMARIFYGRDNVTPEQSRFLQEWVRQLAYDNNIQPRQMQAALWTGKILQEEVATVEELRPFRDFVRDRAKELWAQGRLTLPDELANEQGFMRAGMAWLMARVTAGALYGSAGQGKTPEERVYGALVGAGVGAVLSPTLVAKTARLLGREIEKVPGLKSRPKTSAPQGIAAEPMRALEADKFTSVAEEFAAAVKEATRGVKLDGETGLIKIRPKDVIAEDVLRVRAGLHPQDIADLMPTIKMSAEEAIAMTEVMENVGAKVRALGLAAKSSGYTETSIREFMSQLYLMGKMDPKRLGALAEAGRTLGALNEPVAGRNEFLNQFTELFRSMDAKVTPQQVVDAVASFDSPQQLTTFARQLVKPGAKDYFYEVYINGLLSGPKTWVTNGVSNAAMLSYQVAVRQWAETIARLEGTPKGVAQTEALSMVQGIIETQADAFRAFGKILIGKGDDVAAAYGTKIDIPEAVITADNLGLTGIPGRAVNFLGGAIRTPGRILGGTDAYFKAIASRAQLRALAKRSAYDEIERLGLHGQAARDTLERVQKEFLSDPPFRALKSAENFAAYVTFTRELGEFGQALQAVQRTALGRMFIPFVKAPVNLAKVAGENAGPLGLLSAQIRTELRSSDPAVRQIALAKLSLSSMSLALFAYWTHAGYIIGGGPSNPEQRRQWVKAGWQPYSFDVGAMNGRKGPPKPGDLVAFGRIDPAAMDIGFVADVTEIMGHLSEYDADQFAMALVVAGSKNFASKTWVQGVSQTASLIAHPDQNSEKFMERLATSMIPFSSLLRQTSAANDPVVRQVASIKDALAKTIPGGSGGLAPDTDAFGNHVYLGGGLGRQFVPSSFQPAVDLVSPIFLNSAPTKHQDLLWQFQQDNLLLPEIPDTVKGIRLDPHEKYAWARLRGGHEVQINGQPFVLRVEGMTLPEALGKLVKSELYKAASPGRGEGREAWVAKIIRQYQTLAGRILTNANEYAGLRKSLLRAEGERLKSLGVNADQVKQTLERLGVE